MNITFRQLRVFAAVVDRGSMNRAAVVLHLTPSAVSMQIKEIETQLGLPLFAHNRRRLSLSPAGEHFIVYAKRLLSDLKEAENVMAHLKRIHRGILTIGIMNTAEYFVPRLLARFHSSHPDTDVKLRVANSREQLLALLDAGEVDLSVMARPPKGMATQAEKFAANPHVFVCPPQHPLLNQVRAPVQALAGHPLIVQEQGSGTRVALEAFLGKHRCTPQIAMEIASNETIKQSVMAGMGLALLPLHCIALELRDGLLGVIRIVDTPLLFELSLVHLSSGVLSSTAEAFLHFIIEEGEVYLRDCDAKLLSLAFKTKIRTRDQRRSKSRA